MQWLSSIPIHSKKNDLEKAAFLTEDPFKELNMNSVQVVPVAITSLVKDSLADSGLDNKQFFVVKTCSH